MRSEDALILHELSSAARSPAGTPRPQRDDWEYASDDGAIQSPRSPRHGKDWIGSEVLDANLERLCRAVGAHLDGRLNEHYLKHQHWLQNELPIYLTLALPPAGACFEPLPSNDLAPSNEFSKQQSPRLGGRVGINDLGTCIGGSHNDSYSMGSSVNERYAHLSRNLSELIAKENRAFQHTIGVLQLARASKYDVILEHFCFRACGTFLVVAYAIFLGLRMDYLRADSAQSRLYFLMGEMIFASLFFLEVIVRLVVQRDNFLQHAWNVYDIILLCLQFIDTMFIIFSSGSEGSASQSRSTSGMRQIMMFFRVARIVRLMRFMPQLQSMVKLMVVSVCIVRWLLFAMLFGFYMMCLILTTAVHDHVDAHVASPDSRLLDERFGHVLTTAYTMLLSLTNGLHWKRCSDILWSIHPFWAVLYSSFIVVSLATFVNIFTGLVVDFVIQQGAMERDFMDSQQKKETEDMCLNICEALNDVQKGNGGSVRLDELLRVAEDTHVSKCLKTLQLQSTETRKIFHVLDRDSRGEVAARDFIDACMKLRNGRHNADVHLMLLEIQLENKRLNKEVRQELRDVMMRLNRQAEVVVMLSKALENPVGFWDPAISGDVAQDEHYVSPFSPRRSEGGFAVPRDTHDLPRIRPLSPRPTTPRSP